MPAAPSCPLCGSKRIIYPGFVSFRWSRGAWRPKVSTAELADGAPMHCEECHANLVADDIHSPAIGIAQEKTWP